MCKHRFGTRSTRPTNEAKIKFMVENSLVLKASGAFTLITLAGLKSKTQEKVCNNAGKE